MVLSPSEMMVCPSVGLNSGVTMEKMPETKESGSYRISETNHGLNPSSGNWEKQGNLIIHTGAFTSKIHGLYHPNGFFSGKFWVPCSGLSLVYGFSHTSPSHLSLT